MILLQNVICFHNPDEINGYLSNWFLSDFVKNGITFSSMEQYMMYQKAKLFCDLEIAEKILKTSNAGKIKAFGRSVKNYNDTIWNGTRQIILYEGLLEKNANDLFQIFRLVNICGSTLIDLTHTPGTVFSQMI